MKGKKTGGRVKGTPNKATAQIKSVIMTVINNYSAKDDDDLSTLDRDLLKLEPKDRAKIVVELMKIVMPKNINIEEAEVSITIEDKLKTLSEEVN